MATLESEARFTESEHLDSDASFVNSESTYNQNAQKNVTLTDYVC